MKIRHLPARALTAGIVAVGSLALATTSAFAHDRLLEADPADGTEVTQSDFDSLTLSFSAEPLELGNTVTMTDSEGTEIFDGEPTIDGMKAVVDLDKEPAPGELDVQWRVVSSDGHPITGDLSYTVIESPSADAASDAGGSTPAPASDEGGATVASETVEPVDSPSAETADEQEAKQGSNWTYWLPLLGLALLAIAAGGWLYREPKNKGAKPGEGSTRAK